MSREIAIDIETIGNDDMIDKLPEPEVKYGNTKDEAKRQEKYNEARKEQIEKMGLNPFTGRVCSVAMVVDGEADCRVIPEISDDAERELLQWVFDTLRGDYRSEAILITWNGIGFDLPYLYKRVMVLGLERTPHRPLCFWTKRYGSFPHCDLQEIFAGWTPTNRMKLDTAAEILLGKKKLDHDFSKFAHYIRTGVGYQKIAPYNIQDAELTWELYRKAQTILF